MHPGEPQVVPVLPQHRFGEARLAAYLDGRLPGAGGALQVRQFQGGQSNPTFLLETGPARFVLRKSAFPSFPAPRRCFPAPRERPAVQAREMVLYGGARRGQEPRASTAVFEKRSPSSVAK